MEVPAQSAVTVTLEDYEEGFLAELARLGYAPRSREGQRYLFRHLSRWLATRGLALSELSEEVAGQYVAVRGQERSHLRSRRALRPLLGYLRGLGIVPEAEAAVPATPGHVLLARYAAYLAGERGLAPATVSSYLFQVRPFVVAHADAGRWSSLSTRQVASFAAQNAAGLRPRSAQVRASALRALLGFMWQEGLTASALAAAVGSFAAPAGTAPPRGLSPGQVGELQATLRASGRGGLRNEPMVALMLRLALRAGEVAALLLEDIDWRSGVLSVRGKGNRLDQVPLPADVGEPLARYLRQGRPAGVPHRQVFLALDAPYGPLTAPAVASVAGRALARAGIKGPGAAHRLRHTAACGVLASGGGFAEAGQLLRHTSPQATAVYAKSDIAALRSIARPWPGAAR
ncbi:MAG TPA: tyrosine-type recombinase/integrase [Streptosporangiaceae bacterium]|nr:tyrosine-type recombinase/integrase [Streptosporangiaceae bacterium]